MKKKIEKNSVVIYKTKQGGIELRGDFSDETIWATQLQIADIFGVQKAAISKHISNIFKSGELNREATVSKMEIVQSEGSRHIKRKVDYYNLDVVISVGYRINSSQATQFRIWATKVLKDHLLKGYTVNKKRLQQNTTAKVSELEKTIALITSIKEKYLSHEESEGLLMVIKQYTDTWTTLLAYDEKRLFPKKSKKKGRMPTPEVAYADIATLKKNLAIFGEATELFAQERTKGAVVGILGNIKQSFDGKELYPSIEEKAAHILYFVVKNHPFTDGNKRTGAFLFIRFLQTNNHLINKNGKVKIDDAALTALTLLVAESNPNEKDVMIALIVRLIA